MRAVNDRKDVVFLAHTNETFEWEANARKRDDCVEYGGFDIVAFVQKTGYRLREGRCDLRMGHRQRVGVCLSMSYLPNRKLRICLANADEGLLDGSVDGVKIDDDIFLIVDKISENSVDGACGILDDDTFIRRGMYKLCQTFSGFIKEVDILISEKFVRTGFCEFGVASFSVAYGDGVCPKTAVV